jgi:two-component SAPR family response regulator
LRDKNRRRVETSNNKLLTEVSMESTKEEVAKVHIRMCKLTTTMDPLKEETNQMIARIS